MTKGEERENREKDNGKFEVVPLDRDEDLSKESSDAEGAVLSHDEGSGCGEFFTIGNDNFDGKVETAGGEKSKSGGESNKINSTYGEDKGERKGKESHELIPEGENTNGGLAGPGQSRVSRDFMIGVAAMRDIFISLEAIGGPPPDLLNPIVSPATSVSPPLPVAALPAHNKLTSSVSTPVSTGSGVSQVRRLIGKFNIVSEALGTMGRFLNRFIPKRTKSLHDAPIFYQEEEEDKEERGKSECGDEVFERIRDSEDVEEREEWVRGAGWVKRRVSEIERTMNERREAMIGEKTRKSSSRRPEEWERAKGQSISEEEVFVKEVMPLQEERVVHIDKMAESENNEEENQTEQSQGNGQRERMATECPRGAEREQNVREGSSDEFEEEEESEITITSASEEDTGTEDTEEEMEEAQVEEIQIRQKRTSRPDSLYRYSSIRPRTMIIGLGVCTETQFFSEEFGEGVSETESEDEEEYVTPTGGVGSVVEGSTNAQQIQAPAHSQRSSSSRSGSRPPSPSAGKTQHTRSSSRPHSPLSDMDTESKRNSQAVSTEPSEIDDHSSVRSSDLESCHDLSSPRSSLLAQDTASVHDLEHALDVRKDKAYRIAHELLNTERTYVKVLHLIDQEFQFRVDQENRAHHLFPVDVIPQMFSNVKSIYKLHHDFLLPQLEERMAQWEQHRRIGDIMKNFAPFLKMYTEYVRNFDNAMTIINAWQAKCPRFAAIMDEIHSMEVCANLSLQHHMLSPVQRIPRYEMLLREYLKKLPEESPDRHDTEKALHLVSTAANHANDAMKKIDKFEKLLEIQESLGGAVDLVSPTRELVKEGKIIKISARSGDHQERYVFLLTDLLLLCSPRLMGSRVMSGPQYRLRARYNVENLQVHEGDNLETANTFYIRDNNKSVELYTQTIEEKEQWLEALFRAIHETYQRKSSLKLHCNPDQRVVDLDLGQKQPTLVRSDSVTKCMECGSQFTMVRRKHHCRACGAVVCSKCSSFKASLAYDSGKNVRVCRTCHATLQELSSSTATPSPEINEGDECSLHTVKEPPDLAFRNRGVLEVSAAAEGAVAQGFLQLKTHRKAWVKRWFALHSDFVLYSFKCDADDQALTATPVPGFTVTHLQGTRNESGINDKERERAFKLHHSKKQYIFLAASREDSMRWVAALKKASQAELPSPVQ